MPIQVSKKRRSAGRTPFQNEEGFALIITLGLLTLLILVLFSMTTLTRVETRMAGGTQQMAVARENAKLALNTAIGQLQRYAGPDEVVTARADIDSGNDDNPYWTGIWEDAGMGGPTLLTWLVSGNEDPNNATRFYPGPSADLNRTLAPYDQPLNPYSLPPSWPTGSGIDYFIRLVSSSTTGESSSQPGSDGDDPLHPGVGDVPGGVVVPKVPIFSREFPGVTSSNSAEHVVGHYAYWVGDQGVKASVARGERHWDVDAYNDPSGLQTENEMVRRIRQLGSQRLWFEGDTASFTILEDYPQFNMVYEENEDLLKVLDYSQLRRALGPPDLLAQDFRDRYHDLTHMNHGVLASTEGSGLKLDLSHPNAGSQGQQEFRDAYDSQLASLNSTVGTASFDMVAPDEGDLTEGEAVFFVAPVVSEAVVRYSVWQDETGAIQVRLNADVELWNPYSVDLEGAALLLRLTGLEPIVVDHSYDSEPPPEMDLQESLVHFVPLDGLGTIPAGEVRHVPYTSPDRPARDNGGAAITAPLTDSDDPAAPPPTIEISSGSAAVEVELWLFPSNLPQAAAGIDGGIAGLGTEPVGHFILEPFDLIAGDSAPADDDSPRFGYNVRLLDGEDEPTWLTHYDPRTIGLENTGTPPALESEPDPLTAHQAVLDEPGTFQLLLNNESSPSMRVKVFELPLQEQISLGAFQHLYYHEEPAYAFGNAWGGTSTNLSFDQFFLSSIPQAGSGAGSWEGEPGGAATGWNFPVPNTRILPYRSIDDQGNEHPFTAELQSEESAEHLLVEGMFNINSTSVNAWRSVLGALNIRRDAGGDNFDPESGTSGDWIYSGDPSGEPLTSAIFRFSQTAHLLNTPYQDQAGLENDPDLAYMQGVRELTEDQVYALAYEIVDLLRANAEPFLSLNEFVASGIIEQAIDNVDLGPLSPDNPISPQNAKLNENIPPYSAAFITQGDIVSALAPFMLARSDTFIVRAYGDSHNPATGQTEARAYCEAIVQRVPATLDPTDDPVVPTGNFGRKFETVYFRWLTPGEL